MRRFRRANGRKLTAGVALAATLLHVAFLSLHVAMMAALGFSGEASATNRLGFVICGPALVTSQMLASQRADGTRTTDAAPSLDIETATFCPVCTGAIAPVLALPELPALTPPLVRVSVAPVVVEPAAPTLRHERLKQRSRAPPQSA